MQQDAFSFYLWSVWSCSALPQGLLESPRGIHLPTHFVVAPTRAIVALKELEQAHIHLRIVEVRLQLHGARTVSNGLCQLDLVEESVAQVIAGLGVVWFGGQRAFEA